MPLSWNDIRDRATTFAREWRDEKSERAEAQTFWNEFLEVFGVKRRRVAVFEKAVDQLRYGASTAHGRIDVFWPGMLLAEHKSAGRDLDGAFTQAADYFSGLSDRDLPGYVVVSDFARVRLYDLDGHKEHEFALKDLPKKIHLFGFIAGYRKQVIREQDQVNVEAVARMGELHDLLKRDGYKGHDLEVFLVRLLFCLFADDTGIFLPKDIFRDLIENFTAEDGSDTGRVFDELFRVMNRPVPERQKSLPEYLAAFPYVNGQLFEEKLDPPVFNRAMRKLLLALTELHWGAISPAIFGAMFQAVIDYDAKELRRQIGAHYTSEANILKLIGPLFLDELRAEFERVKGNKDRLFDFWKKLSKLTFLDPACGCGNFLVISYRELRRLEMDVLRAAEGFGQRIGKVFEALAVDVDQFYGIEIAEFPAQVAQVAMWLMDHQMNIEAGELFGEPMLRIPLTKSAHIRLGNALRIDWAEFVPPVRLKYILGNPPFIGKKERAAQQKEDLEFVMHGVKGAGVLDYVAGWYVKAAHYLTDEPAGFGGVVSKASRDRKAHRDVRFGKGEDAISDLFVDGTDLEVRARRAVRCAFVSTNSITQGEQVGVLWSWLLAQGIRIHFAHRTFQWTNEAPGKAAVHCVIVGFGAFDAERKRLFEYAEIKGEPHELGAANINPYLVDAPNVVLAKRPDPICPVPAIIEGSALIDDGHLVLSVSESEQLLAQCPKLVKHVRPFVWGDGFINNERRFCLWLVDALPGDIAKCPIVKERIEKVRRFRSASGREATKKLASVPSMFGEIRQPRSRYIFVPKTSSERRPFVPMGFLDPDWIINNTSLFVDRAELHHLGVMTSTMHMAWMRYVAGRLKNDYRYSNQIVYNNFPWPALIDEQRFADEKSTKLRAAIAEGTQSVLDARAKFPNESLATLYNPETMPPALVKAHEKLDRAVDAAYVPDGGKRSWATDAERVAFLFTRYQVLTSLLPEQERKTGRQLRVGHGVMKRGHSVLKRVAES